MNRLLNVFFIYVSLKTTSIYYILISIILVGSVLHSCFVMSYHLLRPSYHLHVHLSSVIMEFPTAPAGRVAWRASAPAPSAAVAALRTAAPGDVATWQRASQRVPTREFDRYFHQGTT